ncbi:MAG TPA: hypothetical protein VKZ48_04930 [Burkholderiales bacterium]|nr:hypothetical protein [Burkholderiales bacterium]
MIKQGHQPHSLKRRQRGVVLFIALIVLVALTLAGLAMVRSSTSGILVAGNLAFKQTATASSDAGVEAARAWLRTKGPAELEASDATQGYYATWEPTFDPATSAIWEPNTSRSVGAADDAGNTVRYVIHRMCDAAGALKDVDCVTVASGGLGGSKGGGCYGCKAFTGSSQPYFRITVRTTGPKNTVSYVQAMMY